MKAKDFLSLKEVDREELCGLLNLAADIKARPEHYSATLRGKALAMIFEKPSLRTRVSFDVGIHQLGGFSVSLNPNEIQLGKRESVHDVAKNLERMVQAIMIRSFSQELVEELARHSSIPVINGLTDSSHPCQALSDYFTIRELRGNLQGIKVCFVGDGNNVVHSLMIAGAKLGVQFMLACPKGYGPDREILRIARETAKATKARIDIVDDPVEGIAGADVVYTDVWASMGQEAEAGMRKKAFKHFQVTAELMKLAKEDALFMHCLPAHRGEEVTDEVIDGPQSVVFQQAENRLHAEKALLVELMR